MTQTSEHDTLLEIGKAVKEKSDNGKRLMALIPDRSQIAFHLQRVSTFLYGQQPDNQPTGTLLDPEQGLASWRYLCSKREVLDDIFALHLRQENLVEQLAGLDIGVF